MNIELKTKQSRWTAMILCVAMSFAAAAYTCNIATVIGWINEGLSVVATIGPLINPLIGAIAGLAGKTINATLANDITKGLNAVDSDLPLLSSALTAYNTSPSATQLGKINSLVTAIQQNLNTSVLQANGITDPTTQTQVLQAIQELQQDFQQLQALVPSSSTTSGAAQLKLLKKADLQAAQAYLAPDAIKARMHAIAARQTGNAEVNKAFGKLAAVTAQ